ncbi:MAG TPA: hypothetical protein VKU77_10355 [Streptosporangiaceae bacterium]|nr:hypothetical protein [Streptosporangiaceae bacterium]
MKIPAWLTAELDTAVSRIIEGDADRDERIGAITDKIISREAGLVRSFVRSCTGKLLRERIKGRLISYYASSSTGSEPGDQLELFAALPRILETSPGRFAHISTMTGPDWDAALRQAEVKADNSGTYAKELRRAHDIVRPLLGDDGALTTADVAEKIAAGLS